MRPALFPDFDLFYQSSSPVVLHALEEMLVLAELHLDDDELSVAGFAANVTDWSIEFAPELNELGLIECDVRYKPRWRVARSAAVFIVALVLVT